MQEKQRINMKKRIFEIIQIGNRGDLPSAAMDVIIVANILINILCMYLATFELPEKLYAAVQIAETLTIAFFCAEYALRIWTAEYLFPGVRRTKAKFLFCTSFDGVVDLLTILPFFFLSGFVVFRMLRVVRIFHLFRINNQYDSFHVITSVLREKKNQIVSSVFIIIVLMFASSLCMYSAEHDAQPEVFRNAFSGIWWSMSTLLTVGYGDIYPVTVMGRCMAIVIAFLGVGAVAIPTGIISAGFVEQYTKLKNIERNIPHRLQFVTINIEENDELLQKPLSAMHLPQGLTVLAVVHNGRAVVAGDDVMLQCGDSVIIAGESYAGSEIHFTEIHVDENHEWAHCSVKELDISRLTALVSIERSGNILIPRGNTVIEPGDDILLFSKTAVPHAAVPL